MLGKGGCDRVDLRGVKVWSVHSHSYPGVRKASQVKRRENTNICTWRNPLGPAPAISLVASAIVCSV